MSNIKEFESSYSYDPDDFLTQGSGSGIHVDTDISIDFVISDRVGNEISSSRDVISNKYCDAIIFDITDKNGNIIRENYQSGTNTNLTISEKENESIFGEYQKDFGINFKVVDPTSLYSPSGSLLLYGNKLEIKNIKALDSAGDRIFNETAGVYLNANLNPSGYNYSGKMFPASNDSDPPLKYISSGTVYHEAVEYKWDAYLSWIYDSGDYISSPSYENFSNQISGYESDGYWTLVIMDYSPNQSFLMSSGSSNLHNPFGEYIDPMGSGYIKRYSSEPVVNTSGQKTEEEVLLDISYQNSESYTKFSHLDVYSYYGTELNLEKFEFVKRVDDLKTMRSLRYDQNFGLLNNNDLWLKFKPYSKLGGGEPWIVGPIRSYEKPPTKQSEAIQELDLYSKSGASTVNLKFIQREISDITYNSSGVIDKIFVDLDQGYPSYSVGINEPGNYETSDFYTIETDEYGVWKTTTFDYLIEFRNPENPYAIESYKMTLSPTGSSQESPNIGMPLFKIKINEQPESGDINIGLHYNESGVMVLCNTGHDYKSYKIYKTSI